MEQHTATPMPSAQELMTPNEHFDSIDYEVAYYEMRNVAAFIINVIAGEISDGLIIIDEDYSMSAQKRAKIKQVLRISHSLANKCIPTNFKAHDSTLSILLTCMKAVSCEDVANVKHFGDFHDSRF